MKNGTLNFVLQQAGLAVDTGSIVPTTAYCYTSTDGSVVGMPNPLFQPADRYLIADSRRAIVGLRPSFLGPRTPHRKPGRVLRTWRTRPISSGVSARRTSAEQSS
ncbi:MAG: hypothetical protein WCD57_00125 [Acidobacteriaceae bacterium]